MSAKYGGMSTTTMQQNVFLKPQSASLKGREPLGLGNIKVYQAADVSPKYAIDSTPARRAVSRVRNEVTLAKSTAPPPTTTTTKNPTTASRIGVKALAASPMRGRLPSKATKSGYSTRSPTVSTMSPTSSTTTSPSISPAVSPFLSPATSAMLVSPASPKTSPIKASTPKFSQEKAGPRSENHQLAKSSLRDQTIAHHARGGTADEGQAKERRQPAPRREVCQAMASQIREAMRPTASPITRRLSGGPSPWLRDLRQTHAESKMPESPKQGVVESRKAVIATTSEASLEQVEAAKPEITTMAMDKLALDTDTFDLSAPELRSKLLKRLDFAETACIEKVEGDCGSFNEGVWLLSDTNGLGVVLKLVPHQPVRLDTATDAEKYMKLQRLRPNIVKEGSLSFPLEILHLKGRSSSTSKDLIVMRKAPGCQLTQHLYCKFHSGSIQALLDIFNEFGIFMSTIHRVYKDMQHGDCQPSNVFYDESHGFTLIDVADFGFGPYMAEGGEDDVEHFVAGLWTLSEWYGKDLIAECEQQFRRGYMEENQRHGRTQY